MATAGTETLELSASQYQRQWSSLIGAALESWVHQLLFIRHVYPHDTFTTATFLGIRSRVSRHPGVVSYITNALRVAVPAITSGAADEVSLLILDSEENADGIETVREIETYSLRFSGVPLASSSATIENGEPSTNNTPVSFELFQQLERDVRDLVLAAHSLERNSGVVSDTMTFKLVVHIPAKDKTCPVLNEAFATGTWFTRPSESDEDSRPSSKGRVIRPLFHCSTKSMGSILFSVVKTKSGGRKRPPSTGYATRQPSQTIHEHEMDDS